MKKFHPQNKIMESRSSSLHVLQNRYTCNFLKKESPKQVFLCEVCEIFKNTLFYRILPVAASENHLCSSMLRKTEKRFCIPFQFKNTAKSSDKNHLSYFLSLPASHIKSPLVRYFYMILTEVAVLKILVVTI